MLKRILTLAAVIWLTSECGVTVAQPPTYIFDTYQSPNVTISPTADGSLNELVNVWGLANSVPLLFQALEGDNQNWLDWPPAANPGAVSNIFVAWQAVWINNSIYLSAAMQDNQFDADHFSLSSFPANAHQDDGIQLWFESEANLSAPAWSWTTDRNHLVHSAASNYIKQTNEFYDFALSASARFATFLFARSSFAPIWFIESQIVRTDNAISYAVGNWVWFEITYNDADVTAGLDSRIRTLAWNTRGNIYPDEGPWSRLGKMELSASASTKVYAIPEVESVFQRALPVILTSSNAALGLNVASTIRVDDAPIKIKNSIPTHFTAMLSGKNEIPIVSTKGTGGGVLTLNDSETMLTYAIGASGLSGPMTAAYFHIAPAGANGPVVRNLTIDFNNNVAIGTWRNTDTEPLTPALVAALKAGNIYVNLHTAANPAGEIRGQVRVGGTIAFNATLSGNQEVPPIITGASGNGTFFLDATGSALTYDISVVNLSGPIALAAFFNAPAGFNGSLVRTLTANFVAGVAKGTWKSTDSSQPLTPALIGELLAGRVYVNIVTPAHDAGEIRGQVNASASVADSTVWTYWSDFRDAAIIWRATWNLTSKKIFFHFQVFDDYRDASNFASGVKLTDDDALLLLIDFDNNGKYDHPNDINLLIHNLGKIYQYTGQAENYDSPFTGANVRATTDTLSSDSDNWVADVEVDIPASFFPIKPDSSFGMEIGYNDADAAKTREHQLVWNTVMPGAKPWQDFSKLGKARSARRSALNLLPENSQPWSKNYPNPFSSQTTIDFSMTTKNQVYIRVYDLLGRLIATLIDRRVEVGNYQVVWNGTDANRARMANGIYLVVLCTGKVKQVQKIVLIR